eukprot:Blabericola_migrator_1__4136@NODE_2262_length_3039_cov_131_909152_g1424_i0_p4_GENE_NODE_2262_length_3039_cov_131_909152_g1424_i0NODE_2262_length_3039_cov_131_909152_g1424_i0_p4_ORF_typecomplete_len115_score3_65_NODE_2262_length_3039_cov_131_909152_g1424_i06601004
MLRKPIESDRRWLTSDLLLFYERGAFIREKAPRELPVDPPPPDRYAIDKPPGSKWVPGSSKRAFEYNVPHSTYIEKRIYAPASLCNKAQGSVSHLLTNNQECPLAQGSTCFRKN